MTQTQHRILLVDDEPNLRKVLGALLRQQGYEVHAETDGAAALARVRSAPPRTFDVVISDLRMPNLDGIGLLRALTLHEPNLPVILLTAHGSVDSAVEAVKLGAFDYLEKPFDRDQIHQIVQKAIATRERSGPSAVTAAPAEELEDPCTHAGMVGRSPHMQAIRETVHKVAASPSTVLITAESGTGKELVARALHLGSPRRNQPFIKVNCAAIPAGLVESELFGHERGAFTGAVSSRPGRFELADGGTLFLDEVSEIPKRDPGQAAAGHPGVGIRARRRRQDLARTRTPDRRHQPRPRGADQGRQLPRRPLLPPQRRPDPPARAPRAHRGPPAAGRPLRPALQRAPRQGRAGPHPRRPRRPRALPLARQHPRAREPHRAHGPVRLRRLGRRGRPARRLRR
jgi:CheY-like chemotaxis protein